MQKETLSKILNIPHYYVSEIIEITDTEIHLKLEREKDVEAVCSKCNSKHGKGYHSSYEIVVEDLPISGRRVFLHYKKEMYRCKTCIRNDIQSEKPHERVHCFPQTCLYNKRNERGQTFGFRV